MPSFSGLLIVVAVAFAVPFVLGLFPRVRVPSTVLEIVVGIAIGPAVLKVVEPDEAIETISVIGLAFLLFLSGLEIDFKRLRGHPLRVTGAGFVVSFGVAIAISLLLKAGGLVDTPLLVAIILCATSLGVVVAVLKDAGEVGSTFGQLVIAAGSIADFGAIILLSIFFSGEGGIGSTLLLLGALLAIGAAVLLAVGGASRSAIIRADILRLQDTTAQIRVRGAIVLVVGFSAIAASLGLEAILGAFAAGAVLSLVDRDEVMNHPTFRVKLEAIGFGFLIPVFFVTSGLKFDLTALLAKPSNVAMVPVFLLALLLVRGIPALLYRGTLGTRRTLVTALLQATSLPFIVAATAIGLNLKLLDGAQAAALIGAGLLSVLLFPALALGILRGGEASNPPMPDAAEEPARMLLM